MDALGGVVGLVIGLAILILCIWAIVKVVSSSAGTGAKILWVILILLFGPLAVLVWWFAGPK